MKRVRVKSGVSRALNLEAGCDGKELALPVTEANSTQYMTDKRQPYCLKPVSEKEMMANLPPHRR